ncbi:CAP domain-containing protein [Hydrocoleum sp. CS-953]|uniref:CAP domain-containing protein n=1 Tax=Hydrocoleum sp. CS-953 TaxID=1671698 RepID=UPI000B9C5C28|nr:CAP domain-containing protein [Hydrocoleum sp. CS-953]
MTQPTAQDQYMLELVNRGRANPQEEAVRYLNGDINQGLSAGTISTDAKQPLAFNLNLNTAAEDHGQYLLDNNLFTHTGEGGTNSRQRMQAAGYTFTNPSGNGENLAWNGSTGFIDFTNAVGKNHDGLVNSTGHRKNLMNDEYDEIGISSLQGPFTRNGTTFNAVMSTQNFAYSGAIGPFITGVAYTDDEVSDDFYTVGEGIGEITVTAVDTTDSNNTFTTTTWDAGGYSLDVAANTTYDVTFSGDLDDDGQADDRATYRVTVGSENVKQDVVSDSLPVPTGSDDNLHVNGTTSLVKGFPGNDTLTGISGDDSIHGGVGNDVLNGELGNDYLIGSKGDDILNGDGGNDLLNGGTGNDIINGGTGNDTIKGYTDNDILNGDGGNDLLNGGPGNDIINGGTGNDIIKGNIGNDTLTGVDPTAVQPGNNEIDTLRGDAGADLFILGDGQVYYDDNGTADYALIGTFNSSEGDRIQLYGNDNDYVLQENVSGLPVGTAIYTNGGSELIAVVDGVTGMSLSNTSQFSFDI